MSMFSDNYQERIGEIVQEALDGGYTKLEVVNLLAEIISYFSVE